MPKRLIITIVCFHVSAAIAVLAGLALAAFATVFDGLISEAMRASGYKIPAGELGFVGVIAVICAIIWAAGVEIVIWGLNRRQYWAWIAGIVVCGLIIVSGTHNIVGLALGGLGLWGLLDPDSIAAFKPVSTSSQNRG